MKPIPYYVLALAMAVPAIMVGIEIPSWLALGSQTLALQSDFRVFYTPGYMLRTGQRKDIYDFPAIRRNQDQKVAADDAAVPFVHPAYEAVFFVPLSFLPYRAAYVVWAGVNLVVLGLICFLLRPCLPDLSVIGPTWIISALLLGFMPVAFTVLEGQDSLFLLLILTLVYRKIRSNELQAGMLLGLGMFRFQVLLPIIALFLLWRGFRFVAGWMAASGGVLTLSALITGGAAQAQYLMLLRAMGGASSLWLLLRRMPNFRALFVAWGFGIVPLVVVSLSIFLVAAVIGSRQDAQHRFLLAVSVSALIPYYLFFHDLSVLALPLFLAINESIGRRDWLRAALGSVALSGFSVFWFARTRLYLGSLFTLLFLATQATALWRESKTRRLERVDSL